MDKNEYAKKKAEFFRIFASVPAPLRDEIIAVVDNDTYTWHTANAEMEHNTEHAKRILQQLQKMEII